MILLSKRRTRDLNLLIIYLIMVINGSSYVEMYRIMKWKINLQDVVEKQQFVLVDFFSCSFRS